MIWLENQGFKDLRNPVSPHSTSRFFTPTNETGFLAAPRWLVKSGSLCRISYSQDVDVGFPTYKKLQDPRNPVSPHSISRFFTPTNETGFLAAPRWLVKSGSLYTISRYQDFDVGFRKACTQPTKNFRIPETRFLHIQHHNFSLPLMKPGFSLHHDGW
jgi:hypothetical protein